ncbi:MAG: purine-cytosine permease family protein [Thermoleophilia bacterium]
MAVQSENPQESPSVRTGPASFVERRAIEYIPLAERHGRPNTLFTIWFASNTQITTVATGLLATAVFGLSLTWAIIAIVIGNLVGALFMAYHSVQGPRLGMPQMIQSRAQFGMFGAILPIVVVILMYIGFFVSSAILGGEVLVKLLHVSTDWGIIICNIVTLLMAWIGYNFIHRYDRWASVLFAVVFIAITVKMLTVHEPAYHATGDTLANMLLVISIFVSWQITWAPYVSDYSRYLPEDTRSGRTFWFTYLGASIGAVWMMIVGALGGILASSAISANTAGYFAGLFPSIQWLVLITAILGIFAANVENLYGPFLSGAAAVSPSGRVGAAHWVRLLSAGALAIIGTVIAILASPHFLTDLSNFVVFLLYFLIPWTAINLTDYYLVRHGHYEIAEIFKSKGIYGSVNWWAVGIYVLTILIELPFVNSSLYVGPLVKHLGGADISWIIGAIISGVLYYVAATRILKVGRNGALAEQPVRVD